MTLDLRRIILGKEALRRELANRPIAEKLRMLDALRERFLAIQPNASPRGAQPPKPPQVGGFGQP